MKNGDDLYRVVPFAVPLLHPGLKVTKLFFMLNSTEHGISTAHKH